MLTENSDYNTPYFAELNLGDIVSATQPAYTWDVLFEIDGTFYYNQYYKPAYSWAYPVKSINN